MRSSTLIACSRSFPTIPTAARPNICVLSLHFDGGDNDSAEKGFAAVLAEPAAASDPKGMIPVVRLKQIQCWIALKRWNDALRGARDEKKKRPAGDPALAELDYVIGQALLGLGRLEEARAAFDGVINAPQDGELAAQALLMRGETYFHQDQFHEALRDFLKVDILHEAPRWQAAALLEAGKVYERLDQWADAAETYERLLSKFPTAAVHLRPGSASPSLATAQSNARREKGLMPRRSPGDFPQSSSLGCQKLCLAGRNPTMRRCLSPRCLIVDFVARLFFLVFVVNNAARADDAARIDRADKNAAHHELHMRPFTAEDTFSIAEHTVGVAIDQIRRIGSWLSSWYRHTPPGDRVTWGGLVACAGLGLGVLIERVVRPFGSARSSRPSSRHDSSIGSMRENSTAEWLSITVR